MASRGEPTLQLPLQDLLDWAYCPLKVWWRRSGLMPEAPDVSGRHTAAALTRRSLLEAVRLSYHPDRPAAAGAGTCLGWVWRRWLERWELAEVLAGPLVDYHARRRELLRRFEEGGLTRPDGTRYARPMWTRYWQELATSSGLDELRALIDSYQDRAGLGVLPKEGIDRWKAPPGLADAFADAMDRVRTLDLPPAEDVVGVDVPFAVHLPSVQLVGRVDLVRRRKRTRRRGRPSAADPDRGWIENLEMGLFLLEAQPPPPWSLARDLRLLALGQAQLSPLAGETPHRVTGVRVYHLASGRDEVFQPRLGDGLETLESLARAVVVGVRAGAYVPRMVCGWQACGSCACRPLCFADDGVLAVFNPPLAAQVEAARHLRARLEDLQARHNLPLAALRAFGEWMVTVPSLTAEGLLWLLDSWEAEGGPP